MLTDAELRPICEKIKAMSKRDAREKTGVLKRSIAFTIFKGVVTFRQIYYGQFGDNSKLEKNCIKLMPYGSKWRIIYTEYGGKEVESTAVRNGRASQSSIVGDLFNTTTSKIRALIASKKAKDGKKKN